LQESPAAFNRSAARTSRIAILSAASIPRHKVKGTMALQVVIAVLGKPVAQRQGGDVCPRTNG
jgi:hypothetical protein